ncbi:MAG TPA: ankyrin repeat domain-containing protein [Trebonia sp.]|nr:ankyrin repeat domain-containing protein [Trebonia sp.]
MESGAAPMTLPEGDQVAIELLLAIRGGDIPTLERLLAEHPGLERARVTGRKGGWRTPLHMVTDWPGFFPNGPAIVRLLAAAGADPNERGLEPRSETALHWAASSDDAEVAEALIDAGADIHGPEGSIGTPLANAIGYSCWQVARLLVARGARIERLWQAAALGDRGRLEELLGADPAPADEEISQAFWHACQAGHVRIAATLLDRGADIEFSPEYAGGQPPIQAVDGTGTRHQAMLTWLKDHGAAEPSQ